ncbi:MAG: DUF362 domain-containing protein [Candidatus Omnitrophica bacterium]|nr:DUF362 domain-containing protein [Candidatus Omnitrophota bacterium]MDD5518250.1 DUF362 domain-containing protein [Candidatus Omnitrophota bacterium]
MDAQVSIIKCADYTPKLVEVSVRKAIGLIGGIARFVKPGARVLVKPNMLMAKEPECGIDTHPEVVRQVIRVLKDINCHIFVGDSPNVWGGEIENVDEVYRRSGILKVCQEEKVALVKFDKRRMRQKFPLTTWLDHCDYLVSIPKFKTHGLTLLTGAVKNLFGLVTGTFKTELHKNYFQIEEFSKIMADIYAEARPALTIIDGIVAMEGDGPATGGKLRNLGLLLAGSDCVALDSVMAKIMGVKPFDVWSIREASQRGLGVADLAAIKILGERPEDLKVKPFLLPTSTFPVKKFPRLVINLVKRLIKYYPYSVRNNCTRCFACVKICPNKCISMRQEGIVFDYRKCIACFCCQEACPSAAIGIKKSLFAKIIGL